MMASLSLCFGCGGNGDSHTDTNLDRYFLRDAATVEAMGLPVYWLGHEFSAADLVFRGPYASEFGAEVQGGGINVDYFAPLQKDAKLFEGPDTTLKVTTYSRDAWSLVESSTMNPPVSGVTRRAVTVGDKAGTLLYLPSPPDRPLNILQLVVDLGEVVVVGTADAGGPMTPGGPDYSPFINNPDLLVQVMQELRPYPQ